MVNNMVKCVDCENLLQLFVTSCNGHIIENVSEVRNEFLETFDFTCECDYSRTLNRNQIKEERTCSDFEPLTK